MLANLELEEGIFPGQFRTYSVVVGNVYRGAPAEDCEYLLDKTCDWLNGPEFVPPKPMKEYRARRSPPSTLSSRKTLRRPWATRRNAAAGVRRSPRISLQTGIMDPFSAISFTWLNDG